MHLDPQKNSGVPQGVGATILWVSRSLRRIFAERFNRAPIGDAESLVHFLGTRAAYVAQTSMFGYLKTRMGTSFQRHFEDQEFSVVIRDSALRLFESCLSDLTVFAVATAAEDGRLESIEAVALARRYFRAALRRTVDEADTVIDLEEGFARFDARAAVTDWTHAAVGENAFAGSCRDLIRFAPVVDEFKALDGKIVTNSIRFRWRDVREQFRKRADREALCREWRALPGLPRLP